VVGDVKGNLNLESLQDTATFDSNSQSLGASATVGYGASYSASLGLTRINSDYASVYEQSAIKAGDQGFQIKVGGNTSLVGAVIASSAAGAASSSLDTGTLTSSDIANHSVMKATSIGLSGSVTTSGSAGENAGQGRGEANGKQTGPGGTKASMPAVVAVSDSDSSTTRSGVGAGSLVIRDSAGQIAATGKSADETVAATNRKVETGTDTSGAIANNFDRDKVQTTLDVTAAFMQSAAPLAAKVVGDIGSEKQKAAELEAKTYDRLASEAKDPDKASAYKAQAEAARETAANWGDNGAYRVGLHVAAQSLIGGAAGGGSGALSSASGVVAGNQGQQLGKELAAAEAKRQGLDYEATKALENTYQEAFASLGGALGGLAASAAGGQGGAGALVGAAQAGTTAQTVDKYNRQLHQSEAENLANLKKGKSAAQQHRLDAAACALVNCADGLPAGDPLYAKLSAWQKEGQGYIAEQTLLKATGEFVYQPGMDATRDAITRYGEGLHRTGGLVNLGAGSVGAVGGTALAVTGAAACPATLGGGCAAAVFGGYIAVSSRAQAQQGSQALFSKYTSSEGSRVLAWGA
jgi:filamentous hemagglutinin